MLIVDGMADHALFRKIEEGFGRQNVLLIGLESNFLERMRRVSLRGSSIRKAIIRDVIRLCGGIKKVMAEADMIIGEHSADLAHCRYVDAFASLMRQ